MFDERVDEALKAVCLEIEKRYELKFLEIGTGEDPVHFLVQSVPMYRVKKIVQLVKRLTSRELFRRCPRVKQMLCGGEFWRDGYFAGRVGKLGDEAMIGKYVKNQGGNCLIIRVIAARPFPSIADHIV